MVELENGVNEGIVGESMVAFDDEYDMGLERFEGYFANCTVENGVDRWLVLCGCYWWNLDYSRPM